MIGNLLSFLMGWALNRVASVLFDKSLKRLLRLKSEGAAANRLASDLSQIEAEDRALKALLIKVIEERDRYFSMYLEQKRAAADEHNPCPLANQ